MDNGRAQRGRPNLSGSARGGGQTTTGPKIEPRAQPAVKAAAIFRRRLKAQIRVSMMRLRLIAGVAVLARTGKAIFANTLEEFQDDHSRLDTEDIGQKCEYIRFCRVHKAHAYTHRRATFCI